MAVTALRGLSMSAPHANGGGMGPEAFDLGQRFHGFSYLVQAVAGKFLDGDELHEIENAESAAEARLTGCGQNVVRTGGVVARGLRRVITNKNGAGVSNIGEIFASDRNVFGGQSVCPVAGLLAGCGEENGSLLLQRFPGNRVVARGFLHAERNP